MYRLIKTDGTELGVTTAPLFIKYGSGGDFTNATLDNAIGVAFRSIGYNLFGHNDIEGAETVILCEVDDGEPVNEHTENIAKNRSDIALSEDALCEQDMLAEERLAALEDAICELDELLNGGIK